MCAFARAWLRKKNASSVPSRSRAITGRSAKLDVCSVAVPVVSCGVAFDHTASRGRAPFARISVPQLSRESPRPARLDHHDS